MMERIGSDLNQGNTGGSNEKLNSSEMDFSLLVEKNEKLESEIGKQQKIIEDLQKEVENKDKLFGLVAHDLKNPFNSILGFSKMLHEEYDSLDEEEKKEIIKLLTTSANNAYGLLENLLSWSRLHLKGVEVKNQEVNLHNQIIDATSPLVQMAKDKQIEITNKVDHNFVFSTDPDLLSTIVRNLVSNSIKFTNREGHIIISNNNEGNDIEISVSDNGVGIPSEKQKNIFNSLGESTNGTNREKGTGLGLSACKEMAELMGGSIRVESEGEGKGTTFIVTLPIKKE